MAAEGPPSATASILCKPLGRRAQLVFIGEGSGSAHGSCSYSHGGAYAKPGGRGSVYDGFQDFSSKRRDGVRVLVKSREEKGRWLLHFYLWIVMLSLTSAFREVSLLELWCGCKRDP